MAQGTKIPVTVFMGLLGSGKTALLNRMLRPTPSAAAPSIAVITHEPGSVFPDHKLVRHVSDNVSVLASGCACCTVRGELVDALRELFMAALHRKIPVFSHVLIEMSGAAHSVPIMHTLQYQAFLRERYAYDGSICVIDAQKGRDQLRHQPQARQQAVLADLLVISKADLVTQGNLAGVEQELREVNPRAPIYSTIALPPLDELLNNTVVGTGVQRQDRGIFSI